MNKVAGKLNMFKWYFMSPRKKYLYLWHRTLKSMKMAAYS